MNTKAYAKINWMLQVERKREDGYHQLDMIMQKISLYDMLSVEKTDGAFSFESTVELNCSLEDNLLYQAWKLVKKRYNLPGELKIGLIKNIPIGAGLGGGSADAAYLILLIEKLFSFSIPEEEKRQIAEALGMDVAFFFTFGVQRAQGRGEQLLSMGTLSTGKFLIITPKVLVPTPSVYKELKKEDYKDPIDAQMVWSALQQKNYKNLQLYTKNDLEAPLFRLFPQVERWKKDLISQLEPKFCMVSGSGPSIILIPKDYKKTRKWLERHEDQLDIFEVEGVNE